MKAGRLQTETGVEGPAHDGSVLPAAAAGREVVARRFDAPQAAEASQPPELLRYPQRLTREQFYLAAYPLMLLARRLEERLAELFQKGYVKGTVTLSIGNEGTSVPMAMPLRAGRDVVSLLHRDFGAHLLLGATPKDLLCQYLANAESPTHGLEGNVHHGDAARRRFPMISHLGRMLSLVVGGVWAARQQGEEVFGLAAIGDGGTSTGEFHEAVNLASVRKTPVLFLIENNAWSFSTPTHLQYNCGRLSDRAAAYGIAGQTVDGADAFAVYEAVVAALDVMRLDGMPRLLECLSVRLLGHAAYDKGEYVTDVQRQAAQLRDPLPAARRRLLTLCGLSEMRVAAIERAVEDEVREATRDALATARPAPTSVSAMVYAEADPPRIAPLKLENVKNGAAVRMALERILEDRPAAFLCGLDVGTYGSAFKTCKGLVERFTPQRVLDMPLCESAILGFALGASQTGGEPIVEFQFADFSTEAATQLGLNAATWRFRTGQAAPLLVRLPCGGGLTLGAFHSGEFEGLWSRFPGLKLLYPATPQETYEALLAGFHDPNPCVVFEHKLLYWSRPGAIDFDGDLKRIWRNRVHRAGTEVTLVAWGAMLYEALAAADASPRSIEVINPFVLQPLELGEIFASLEKTGRLVVAQESGATQGLGEAIIARAACRGRLRARPRLIAAADAPVPFAPELEAHARPNAQKILQDIEMLFEDP